MAACWLNQYHPRNKTRPWCANASRGKRNRLRNVLQSTATKIVTKLMNWNQYRVGTLLQRVHTDCLGRKFSPQRSQYTGALPGQRTTSLQSLSGYCERRSKNYWPEGQFWSRSFFLHKGFQGQMPSRASSRCAAFPRFGSGPSRPQRNHAGSAPAFRPCSSNWSSFFSRSAFLFSRSFTWPFRSSMYATFFFIPVVTSNPPVPYFLMSSFNFAICCSVAVIWSSNSCAFPRQYTSSCPDIGTTCSFFFPSVFFAPANPAPAVFSSPTTEMPLPRILDKSSSVYTFFGLALSLSDFFAASSPASLFFCSGCVCDCVCEDDCCEACEWPCCGCPNAAAAAHSTARKAEKLFSHKRPSFFMRGPHAGEYKFDATPGPVWGQGDCASAFPGSQRGEHYMCRAKYRSRAVAPAQRRLVQCQFTQSNARNLDGVTNGYPEICYGHSGLSHLQDAAGTTERRVRLEVRLLPPCLCGARRYSRYAA